MPFAVGRRTELAETLARLVVYEFNKEDAFTGAMLSDIEEFLNRTKS